MSELQQIAQESVALADQIENLSLVDQTFALKKGYAGEIIKPNCRFFYRPFKFLPH